MLKSYGILWCVLAALALACADERTEAQTARRAEAEETLSRAPADIRVRVSQTCNRWADLQGSCDEELLEDDILECWLEAGLPHLRGAIKREMRQRPRYRKVVMHHSLCLQRHGWRFLPNTGGHF